jgi:hypothetical protein
MNNYINPYSLIKELYSEATTLSEKSLAIFMSVWIVALMTLSVSGIGMVIYELITNPTAFSNATWGIFDTLG